VKVGGHVDDGECTGGMHESIHKGAGMCMYV